MLRPLFLTRASIGLAATAAERDDIVSVEIRTSAGEPVLVLS